MTRPACVAVGVALGALAYPAGLLLGHVIHGASLAAVK